MFEEGEVRNVFLSQAMGDERFEDSERELLSGYLNKCVLPKSEKKQVTRSVYKYKPVALKTKPVIGKLPGEFRIKREILGDLLVDIPEIVDDPSRV
jgi:hypothetical protein